MKSVLVVIAMLLLAGAYVGGYWPEHRELTAAQSELQSTKIRLAEAEDKIRMYQLENRILGVIEKATDKNYGDAQKLSTEFFDQVRPEIARTAQDSFRTSLESALLKRDQVTAGLTQGDPAVLDLLRQMLVNFRQVLGSEPATAAGPQ